MGSVTYRVKVPSKESLEHLMATWNRARMPVINGECELPGGKDPKRAQTIDFDKMSHAITDIRPETFDPKTSSVAIDVVFTGRMSPVIADAHVRGDLRFAPRFVTMVPDNGGPVLQRIITWDAVTRPPEIKLFDRRLEVERQKMRDEENVKDKATELRKKKGK